MRRRKTLTVALLAQQGEASPAVRAAIARADYATDQVLGDWLPERASDSGS